MGVNFTDREREFLPTREWGNLLMPGQDLSLEAKQAKSLDVGDRWLMRWSTQCTKWEVCKYSQKAQGTLGVCRDGSYVST